VSIAEFGHPSPKPIERIIGSPAALALFPQDIVARAKYLLERHAPGTGAYT
jgi:hypothetical protein